MRQKKTRSAPSHERWLVSYADFVTMMFAVFVVLFASAHSDHRRQVKMAAAMRAAFSRLGVFPPESRVPPLPLGAASSLSLLPVLPLDDGASEFAGTPSQRAGLLALKKRLEAALAPEIRRRTVALHFTRDGLVISLMEIGFFDSGSAALKPGSAATIRRIVQQLQSVPNDLRIEGHTDDVPIHSALFASNWELSTARATTLAELLIQGYALDPARLSAAGYAQYHPAASNADAAGRARNRRVDVVILPVAVPARRRPAEGRSNALPRVGAHGYFR
jgi:chemotaxis protein MotB